MQLFRFRIVIFIADCKSKCIVKYKYLVNQTNGPFVP